MNKYNFGDFEIPYSKTEAELLKEICDEGNKPFFQDSLFHLRLGLFINKSNIEGDFVETGVYNGMSAASITIGLRFNNNKNFKVYLYDSWEGFPKGILDKDGEIAYSLENKMAGSLEGVKLKMEKLYPKNIIYRKGFFKQTFELPISEKISILHIDCDLYESVLDTLEKFYDNVVEKGLIILDDFGAFQGCRNAFYDFCEKKKIRPLIRSYDHTRVFWNKTEYIESNLENNTVMDYNWQGFIKVLNKNFI